MQYQTTNSQQDKKLRQNEKIMEEWQIKMNELTIKLDMSQSEARQHAADANQYKTQLDDAREHSTSLRRENKVLSG